MGFLKVILQLGVDHEKVTYLGNSDRLCWLIDEPVETSLDWFNCMAYGCESVMTNRTHMPPSHHPTLQGKQFI